jgi:isopentenyl-diphosphate delta-isomerase
MQDLVVLVDTKDKETGIMDKLEAHQKGLLHRAFSVIIFNSSNQFLLQRRANDKYHSAGLWSNTCCSHPMPEETVLKASHRRLKEEMGLDTDSLKEIYNIIYKIDFENGLTEHELDHIIIGFTDDIPVLNKKEASDWKYISYTDLKKDISEDADRYTFWFRMIFEKAYRLAMKARESSGENL